jgi:hypothetical protein
MAINPAEEVIEKYFELWKWWFGEVGTYSAKVAANLGDGTYTPDEAAGDASAGVKLLTEAWTYAAMAFLGSQEVLKQDPLQPRFALSADLPLQPSTATRTLSCPNGLTPTLSDDVIPGSAVFSDPAPIPAGATSFRVKVNAAGHNGLIYYGHVVLTDGTATETIPVAVKLH